MSTESPSWYTNREGDAGRPRVRALLRRRPELVRMDLAGDNEHRALHFAVLARDAEMVQLLMEAGADPHQGIYPHQEATSACTLARERGYTEIVAALEEGERRRIVASGRAPSVTSLAPLADALRRGAEDAALQLLRDEPSLVSAWDREGASPLHLSASHLCGAVVAWLLEHGADVHSRDSQGRTSLDLAALAVHWRNPGSRIV